MKSLRSYPDSNFSNEEIEFDSSKFSTFYYSFITIFINAVKHLKGIKFSFVESKQLLTTVFSTHIFIKTFTYMIGLIWLLIIIITIF
ncbi:MAG TPA: hypothetical protein VD908_13780 [Cytophagales bacterium]|nr:hypothetical protein [Cytophagales bacterium]